MSTSDSTSFPEIRSRIDDGPLAAGQYLIFLICFLLNLADGFDLVAMSYAAPALSDDWGVQASELGVIFSAALAGMTIGAMFLSPLSDKLGRRTIILFSSALTSVSMLSVLYVDSITQMVVMRFLTGLGIGGILASAASVASEFAPERYRSFAVVFVGSGFAVGQVIGGPIAADVIPDDGWRQLFLYGGLLTAGLFVLACIFLPESIEYTASKTGNDQARLARINNLLVRMQRQALNKLPRSQVGDIVKKGNIGSLLNARFRRRTLHLWAIFFPAYWSSYFLVNWIPTLFVNSGLTQEQGIFALTLYTLGGLIGALSIGYLSTRLRLVPLLAIMFLATAALLGLFVALKPESLFLSNTLVLAMGFTFIGSFTALYAVVTQIYPAEIRATGLGWSIGLGRIGAILSPLVAGFLVSAGWGMYGLFLFIAIPPILLSGYLIWKLEH